MELITLEIHVIDVCVKTPQNNIRNLFSNVNSLPSLIIEGSYNYIVKSYIYLYL